MQKIAVIDYELVYDVWSLLFCVLRMNEPLTNSSYPRVINRPLAKILKPEQVGIFNEYLVCIKPWYPAFSFCRYLENQGFTVQLKVTCEGLTVTQTDWQLYQGQNADLVISSETVRPRKIDEYKMLPDWSSVYNGFVPTPSTQSKIDLTRESFKLNLQRPEFRWSSKPVDVTVEGRIVHGFQRGSKSLGVPTANVEMTAANLATLQDAVPGVYMAYCKHNGHTYKAAVSIGWNPFYDNDVKTLEAYLISSEELPDFYGQQVTVQLRRYIRPEALFDTFDGLLIAISCDIQATIDTEF